MTKRTGVLYGIGVGPGDPELMTLKAVRQLKECSVVALPARSKEGCVAYQIAVQSVPELEGKECLYLDMPMTKDAAVLESSHQKACSQIMESLRDGKDVGFITLGDSTIYSTCLYILERVQKEGFGTGLVNGIPSFCAAAARMNRPLVNGSQELHIIPASYQVETAMGLEGIKVFMKSGRQFGRVKEQIKLSGQTAVMVENCGMVGERVFETLEQMPDEAGYYTLLIVSEEKGHQEEMDR